MAELNAPGISAPILPDSGHDALEQGWKRKAVELQQAKDKKAEQDKINEGLKLDYKPVWKPGEENALHGERGLYPTTEKMNKLYKDYGNEVANPQSPAFWELQKLQADFKQNLEKEVQDKKYYDTAHEIRDKNKRQDG